MIQQASKILAAAAVLVLGAGCASMAGSYSKTVSFVLSDSITAINCRVYRERLEDDAEKAQKQQEIKPNIDKMPEATDLAGEDAREIYDGPIRRHDSKTFEVDGKTALHIYLFPNGETEGTVTIMIDKKPYKTLAINKNMVLRIYVRI